MNVSAMTRQELQTAVTDLLEWRAQVEVRLAAAEKWHTPALNPATDVDAYDGRWFSGSGEGLDFLLPTFAEAAWDLTVRWLWEEYGLGSSGEAVHYYEDGEEKYSCGCYAYDENRQRNEVYLCTAASHGDEVGLAILVEWLTDFHLYKSLRRKTKETNFSAGEHTI